MTPFPWKTVWIVGGSTGMGSAAVKQLDASGVKVYVSARSEATLTELCAPLKYAEPVPLDITDADAVQACVEAMVARNSRLPDLIVLNAAIYTPMSSKNFDAKAIADMIEVNYLGYVHMISALLPYRNAPLKTTIAAVGSPSGWRGLPGGIGYGPTKAAIINLFEGLRAELRQSSLDIRLVTPGFIRTRLTEKNDFSMPQLMEPEVAAAKMLKGLAGQKFDTAFPNPFIFALRVLRQLPYSLYFYLVGK